MVIVWIVFVLLLNGCATPAPAAIESMTLQTPGIPVLWSTSGNPGAQPSLEAQRDAETDTWAFFSHGWQMEHTLWTLLIGGLVVAGVIHQRRKPAS